MQPISLRLFFQKHKKYWPQAFEQWCTCILKYNLIRANKIDEKVTKINKHEFYGIFSVKRKHALSIDKAIDHVTHKLK